MTTAELENLIAQNRSALASLRAAGTVARPLLEALEARLDALVQEYQAQWAAANDDEKKAIHGGLSAFLHSVDRLSADGPNLPASEMHKAFASNARIYGIALWTILGCAAMIILVLVLARRARAWGMPDEIASALPLVTFMGALGGFLTAIQSFGRYVGNRQFLRSWTLYYFLFPLKGAGLAIIVFFLVHTDLGQQQLNLGTGVPVPTATTNALARAKPANAPADLGTLAITNAATNVTLVKLELSSAPAGGKKPNLVLALLVAALTGMFANQAIEMLATVFSVIFKKVEGKDPHHDEAGPPSTGKPTAKP